jgi:uncharacterized lipoprotein YddW (UPF0748 family)
MKKTSFAFVLLLLVAAGAATSQVSPKHEFRGVWLTTVGATDWPPALGGPVQRQKDSLVAILDRLHGAGFNAVIFQVRPECDALYQSSIEPWSYWLTGSQGTPPQSPFDPLQFIIDECHKRGMELHAWFNPYRAVNSIGQYLISSMHVSVQHPGWILTIGSLKMLDPGLPDVRAYVTSVILDVTRRYDLDGIHMDDYFYASGITAHQDDSSYGLNWRGFSDRGDWRRDNVNILLQGIYDSIMAVKPWVKFGMSPAGIWRDGVPPGTSGQDNYSVIYGDPMAWLDGQYVDYLAQQLYWKFGGPQDYATLEPWWSDSIASHGRHSYPGLATYRIGTGSFGDASQIAQQIRFSRADANTQGNIQFTANYITSGNTGGITDTLRNNVYQYPALIAPMPWKDMTPPYVPRGIRYAALPGVAPAAIQWDLPIVSPNGDTAFRYVVYRFDHRPAASELSNAQNILSVEGRRYSVPPLPPSSAGAWYYVVTALSRNYTESDTSNFIILSAPPAPPLLAPVSGAADVPESLHVTWRSSLLASGYQLQVGTDPAFATGLIWNETALADTFRLVKGFQGQTLYYWRVRAMSGGGLSSWSAASNFRTGFPASPPLAYPPNLQADLPVFLALRWGSAPSLKAVSYRVQIGKSADFASPVMDSSGVADTTLAAPPLQYFTIYFWRVLGTNSVGTGAWSPVYKFRTVQVTGVEPPSDVPSTFGLYQNYPNPFNPATMIGYQLPAPGHVTIIVYDLLGQEFERLVDEVQAAGRHSVPWDGSNRASGVYLVRMNSATFVSTKRMILLK